MSRPYPLVALVLLQLATVPAHAAQRTFVSINGSDANAASNCSNTMPCRGFAAALTVTDPAGEIIVQNSGGYGAVTVDKSVSIIAPRGVYAGISVFSGSGISIATPGVEVVLRGLTINGLGGTTGVDMTAGASLTVEGCTIKSFNPGQGISVSTAAKVRIVDSMLLRNNFGVWLSGGAKAMLTRARLFDQAGDAVHVDANGAAVSTKAEVVDSDATGNHFGFVSMGISGGTANLFARGNAITDNSYSGSLTIASSSGIEDSLIVGNSYGISAGGAAGYTIGASGNRVVGNGSGFQIDAPGQIETTLDNTVRMNGSNIVGTATAVPKM